MAMDLEKLAQDFDAQENVVEQTDEIIPETKTEELSVTVADQPKALAEQNRTVNVGFSSVVGSVQSNILEKAKVKITDEKIVEKHAENLADIADKALEVQAETASLKVQEQEADNKVRKQEIRNKLIVLNAEATRLKREQKQFNKEQKADHKARNKQAKWELYKDKLTKMKYSYVPNAFILSMLLFFDGVKSFFDGLGTVNTAIVKACKWLFLIGAVLTVLFSIPATREWLINLLSSGGT